MKYRTNDEIVSLVRAFESRALPKERWTHAAHLTIGLHYCLRYALPAARNIMRAGISQLNERHGITESAPGGYHETLTLFWLEKIAEFAKRGPRRQILTLANDMIEELGDPELPFRSYSRERLFSPEAKVKYVASDYVSFIFMAQIV